MARIDDLLNDLATLEGDVKDTSARLLQSNSLLNDARSALNEARASLDANATAMAAMQVQLDAPHAEDPRLDEAATRLSAIAQELAAALANVQPAS